MSGLIRKPVVTKNSGSRNVTATSCTRPTTCRTASGRTDGDAEQERADDGVHADPVRDQAHSEAPASTNSPSGWSICWSK